MKKIHPLALFRLSVLGPLASRDRLEQGELKRILSELAAKSYAIPDSKRVYISEKTIAGWYYAWKRGGIEALTPKLRSDRGISKISQPLQDAIIAMKKDKPSRSLRTIKRLVGESGISGAKLLSRSSIHRFLQSQGLSGMTGASPQPVERRAFVAAHAGDIWYGDVLHGPSVLIPGRIRKTYLISFMDDASRLITHSAFCPAETALEVEGVFKQAVLKRGLPIRLVTDNGSAYRSETFQGICARLEVKLIYCRPYVPEGKAKLERYHRTLRNLLLNELDMGKVRDIHDLNARLWAWVEEIYHKTPHGGLDGFTPLERYQRDLVHIRPLGHLAPRLDELFLHRFKRLVRKDGTVSYEGERFEVPFELTGKNIFLVVDPHAQKIVRLESDKGDYLGKATPLDPIANRFRKRISPIPVEISVQKATGDNLAELALRKQMRTLGIDFQEEV